MFQTCWFPCSHTLIFHMQTALGETLKCSLIIRETNYIWCFYCGGIFWCNSWAQGKIFCLCFRIRICI